MSLMRRYKEFAKQISFLAILMTCFAGSFASASSFQRIVSIGSSTTEILYALDMQDSIVAVDTTSLYPSTALQSHANVGYMRALSAEPILSLGPDLVITEEGAEPSSVFLQLQEAGVEILQLPNKTSIDGLYEKIELIAEKLSLDQAGDQLKQQIQKEFAETSQLLESLEGKPRTLFLLSVASGALTASGAGTSADDLIRQSMGKNVFDSFQGYRPVNAEALIIAAPEVILLPSHSVEMAGGIENIQSIPEIGLTPAGKNGRIYVVDSTLTLGFGPRLPLAIRSVALQIHQ